jgi:hypothetical protein
MSQDERRKAASHDNENKPLVTAGSVVVVREVAHNSIIMVNVQTRTKAYQQRRASQKRWNENSDPRLLRFLYTFSLTEI